MRKDKKAATSSARQKEKIMRLRGELERCRKSLDHFDGQFKGATLALGALISGGMRAKIDRIKDLEREVALLRHPEHNVDLKNALFENNWLRERMMDGMDLVKLAKLVKDY